MTSPRTLPATLSSLPTEILVQIANLLDLPSALCFARIARRFTKAAEGRIWREIEIFSASPDEAYKELEWGTLERKEAYDAQRQVTPSMRERLEKLLEAGDERKWRLVESLRMTSRPDGLQEMAYLLEKTSSTLRSLAVFWPGRFDVCHVRDDDEEDDDPPEGTIDMWLLSHSPGWAKGILRPAFPLLTHCEFAQGTILCVEFIPILLAAAPSLISLDIEIDENKQPIPHRSADLLRHRLVNEDTQLQSLRISYEADLYVEDDAYDSFDTLVSLFHHCPRLRRLCFGYMTENGYDDAQNPRVPASLVHLTALRDFRWMSTEWASLNSFHVGEGLPGEMVMRRMVIPYEAYILPAIPFQKGPDMPYLEALFLKCSGRLATIFDPEYSVYAGERYRVDDKVLRWLRDTPRLRFIHFFRSSVVTEDVWEEEELAAIEDSDDHACQIWSMRHGDQEVLHLRLRICEVPLSNIRDHPSDDPVLLYRVLHVDGEWDDTGAPPISGPVSEDIIDFNGKEVPPEILARMREIEGVVDDAEWNRRGVEVGEEAWQVLLDWEAAYDIVEKDEAAGESRETADDTGKMTPPKHEPAPLHAPNPPLTPPNGATEDPALLPRLNKIPPELIIRICSHLDIPSALSMALVSHALSPSAIDRLWASLDLIRPHVALRVNQLDNPSRELLDEEERKNMSIARVALQDKLAAIQRAGDDGDHWRKVASFSTAIRPGCEEPIMAVLRHTAPTLRSLRISLPREERYADYGDRGSLELRLSQRYGNLLGCISQLALPALEHIRIGGITHVIADTILRVCSAASNATSLQLQISHRHFSSNPIDSVRHTPFYRLTKDTKLLQLHVDYVRFIYDRPEHAKNSGPVEAMIDLLIRSPRLQRLALRYEGDAPLDDALMARIGLMEVKDMYWKGVVESPLDPIYGQQVELPSSQHVRRLVVEDCLFPSAELNSEAHFRSLELIVLHLRPATPFAPVHTFPPSAPILPLNTAFVRWLSQRPRLHRLYLLSRLSAIPTDDVFRHLDELDRSGSPNAIVTSLRYGEDELFLVRIALMEFYSGESNKGGVAPAEAVRASSRIIYDLSRTGAKESGAYMWQTFTSYKGAPVPLEVVRRMKKADDPAGKRDWDKRGVEVGDAAWEILRTSLVEQGESEKW